MNRTYDFSHWGGKLPKASCLCPTYGRPHLLGEAIESFLRQDYPGEKELIVLNDHPDIPLVLAEFPGVRLINRSGRFNSLGEKRNALAAMATGGIFFPWDDDDISLPWRLSATLERMTNRHYFKPTDYWWWTGANVEHQRNVMAHAMSGYSRELFEEIGGYPEINSGEDQGFEARVHSSGKHSASELGPQEVFYIYRLNHVHTYHISAHGFGSGWEQCAEHVEREVGTGSRTVEPAWSLPFEKLAANRSLPPADMPETHDPEILVGICSCHKNSAKRDAVRDTWLAELPGNVSARFFVGQGTSRIEESETVVLDVPDDYDSLPGKVLAFFRYALENHGFDHLFKCDDDTYLAPERLTALARSNRGIVGNIRLEDQGFACGGAGYLLSREWVEAVVRDSTIPSHGYEDRLITRAAMRAGAVPTVCRQLFWNTEDFPRSGNQVISAHWCTPGALRTIHAYRHAHPSRVIEVVHPQWHDRLDLFADGRFSRTSKPDGGRWTSIGDAIVLHWHDWQEETAVPANPDPPSAQESGTQPFTSLYKCLQGRVETVTIELSGGMGNQLFQYAHGLALARRTGASLRVTYGDYSRAFSLGLFGVKLDDEVPEPSLIVEDLGSRATDQDWPSFEAICRSQEIRHVRVRGFFQHETYFSNVVHEMRKLLEPSTAAARSTTDTLVCVHVRRGDFVGCRKHEVCRLDYFLLAMKIIRGLVPCPRFQVFSDDPKWCQENFPTSDDMAVLERMPESVAFEEMSRCRAFVLSNSTFGWWAAWISDSGPVIAPNRFLANRDWNICPESWIQLPSHGGLHGPEVPIRCKS